MIMTLPCTYIYEILVHIKISLNTFNTNFLLYSYNTRNKFDLFVISHNTKLFEQSLAHISVLIFNKLSAEIKNNESITKFKKILFNFFTEQSFYSMEEFMTLDP